MPEEHRQSANTMQPETQLRDDVVAAMAKSSSGWKIVREQLKEVFFSIFDMVIHTPTSHEALEAMNLAEVFNKLKSEIYSLPGGEATGDGWEWGHGEAVCETFLSHLGPSQPLDISPHTCLIQQLGRLPLRVTINTILSH